MSFEHTRSHKHDGENAMFQNRSVKETSFQGLLLGTCDIRAKQTLMCAAEWRYRSVCMYTVRVIIAVNEHHTALSNEKYSTLLN